MKKYGIAIFLMLAGVITQALPLPVLADPLPALSLREVKITGDEFIVLVNSGSTDVQLADYWLGYVGSDTAEVIAPPSQRLPNRILAPGKTLLLSGGGTIDICDASIVTGLSLNLSDSKGKLALWLQTSDGFTQLIGTQAQIRWGKSTAKIPLPLDEIDLKRETTQYVNAVWYFADTNSWVVANFADCTLTTYASTSDTAGAQVAIWPQNDSQPPATIVGLSDGSQTSNPFGIPPADIGLAAPIINELLPNPAEPQTDSEDEFIELYNSNDTAFDLTGFKLQTGTTSLHTYSFPAGSNLPPKSFTAFFSTDTDLSLSNFGGQARLLDPVGNTISQSDIYSTAKEGQTWALANGTWYWSTTVTPNAANIVSQPLSVESLSVGTAVAATSAAKKSSKSASTAAKKSSANSKPKVKAASTPPGNGSSPPVAKNASPLHPLVLAGVGAGALAYAAYEYRNDLRNRLYQFRRYAAARRTVGK